MSRLILGWRLAIAIMAALATLTGGLLTGPRPALAQAAPAQADWGYVRVSLEGDGEAVLENSLIRVRYGKARFQDGFESYAITDFVIKSANENQVGDQPDGVQHLDGVWIGEFEGRGPLTAGWVAYDGDDRKTLHLEWDGGKVTQEVSIFPDRPHLKIDYLSYGVNVVDIGTPGGVRSGATYRIYGAERWVRGYELYPDSYYNVPEYGDDPRGGSLNYNGWLIMGSYNPANDRGFGRVSPVGAVNITKLLFNRGFEQFPYYTLARQPYTQYLFAVTGGAREIISLGQQIADGNVPPYTGGNLALGRPATADSACNAAEGAAKAVDGATVGLDAKWCSVGATKWWRVELGADTSVARVVIKHSGAGEESPGQNTRDFDLQVSTNGSTWSTVAQVRGNTASETTHTFAPTQARYVRLQVLTPTQTGDAAARIYEVEVYAR